LGCALSHTSFESLPHAAVASGTQAENKPTHLRAGDRKFTSDPCITGDLEARAAADR
jgi:hypothetical protein